MLLRQIEGFLAVARLGNLSRAAEELFLTQPTLTARLKALEQELGEELFVRTGRGMRLTDAGRVFLPYAERAVASLREGRERIEALREAQSGRLTVAASPGVSTYALPQLLESFVEAHPGVEVSVRTGHSEEVLEMVLREEVQLGLGRAMRHPDIQSLPLYEDELVLVVSPGHPFAERGEVTLEEVGREHLILFDRTSSYYDLTRAMFRTAGVSAPRVMELDNIEAAKRMVERGLGVSLLPRSSVARMLENGRLALVRIEDAEPPRRPIVVFLRKDVPVVGAVAAFLEVARSASPLPERAELPPALAAEFENLQLVDFFT
ncbi:LysR family transcriptional regulator [Rubrobacter taiwanensis]|uniref:LysR family transcriptional regulator n=1 Tax=Rubrobacter taiwanensis TaxID=185139 RepID=A0A4R1BG27_9ACTN|nr:LysR family transcriptional regulator [Rubrobacter taiwanensis]TCJ16165.1 LysR family transcriptional regulator [Rubrobacter taiwanensis]